MAQQPTDDFNIDPEVDSGTLLAGILNRWHEVIRTMNSGPTRPVDALAGSLWLETDPVNAPIQTIYFYDGNSDLGIAEINVTTHAIEILGCVQNNGDLIDGDLEVDGVLKVTDTVGDFAKIDIEASATGNCYFTMSAGTAGIVNFLTTNSTGAFSIENKDTAINHRSTINFENTGLNIESGTNEASIQLQPDLGSGVTSLKLNDDSGIKRGELEYDDTLGWLSLNLYNAAGASVSYIQMKAGSTIDIDTPLNVPSIHPTDGASGSFTSNDGKTITVTNGIITGIV